MSRLVKPFRGLRWKLTLSYTAVTVATLLVLEILLIFGIGYIIFNTNLLPNLMVTALETFITPQVASFLDNPQPNTDSLREWLDFAYSEGISFQSAQNPNVRLELGELDQGARLIVMDQKLEVLVSRPELSESEISDLFQSSAGLMNAALQGKRDAESISRKSGGKLTTAVPVVNEDMQVLGVVLMIIDSSPRGSIVGLISLGGASLILFSVATGIIGTIFGFFTARALTKRLWRVSQAAESWSQGDFTAFIQDRSGDELSQMAQQLNRMAEQLQNLLQTQQELATLEERNRLARDLHDSVKQQVFATTMQLAAARAVLTQDPEAAQEHLDEAESLARQAQRELTTIILELQPGTLQGKGLAQALKEYIADWSRLNEITAQINMQGECTLPLEIKQTLFRVAQEGLSNIARHSQATRVGVQLLCNQAEISLTLSDNGVGFDPSSSEGKGIGLRIMHERMQDLGGKLRLESEMGKGTHLTAVVRYKKEG